MSPSRMLLQLLLSLLSTLFSSPPLLLLLSTANEHIAPYCCCLSTMGARVSFKWLYGQARSQCTSVSHSTYALPIILVAACARAAAAAVDDAPSSASPRRLPSPPLTDDTPPSRSGAPPPPKTPPSVRTCRQALSTTNNTVSSVSVLFCPPISHGHPERPYVYSLLLSQLTSRPNPGDQDPAVGAALDLARQA